MMQRVTFCWWKVIWKELVQDKMWVVLWKKRPDISRFTLKWRMKTWPFIHYLILLRPDIKCLSYYHACPKLFLETRRRNKHLHDWFNPLLFAIMCKRGVRSHLGHRSNVFMFGECFIVEGGWKADGCKRSNSLTWPCCILLAAWIITPEIWHFTSSDVISK